MRKETTIDRILLVLNPDGSLKACHQERLERVIDDDGQVITERYLPAEPVAADALAGLIGAPAAQWAAQVVALSARMAELEAGLGAEAERNADLARRLAAAFAHDVPAVTPAGHE